MTSRHGDFLIDCAGELKYKVFRNTSLNILLASISENVGTVVAAVFFDVFLKNF